MVADHLIRRNADTHHVNAKERRQFNTPSSDCTHQCLVRSLTLYDPDLSHICQKQETYIICTESFHMTPVPIACTSQQSQHMSFSCQNISIFLTLFWGQWFRYTNQRTYHFLEYVWDISEWKNQNFQNTESVKGHGVKKRSRGHEVTKRPEGFAIIFF